MREIQIHTPPAGEQFLAYELWTITNPDLWARENKKKGQRESTLIDIERRRSNRWTLKKALSLDKHGYMMNDPNTVIVIEIMKEGTVDIHNSMVLFDEKGKRGFFKYQILRPITRTSKHDFTAETSEGVRRITVHPTSLSVKIKPIDLHIEVIEKAFEESVQ